MGGLLRAPLGACLATLVLALSAGGASADAAKDAAAKQKQAARLVADGDYARALAVIDEGLALAPGRLPLLQLRAATLFEMRDFEGALAAYETFLAANPKGANRRAAVRIIANLEAVRTTALDLTIAGATAEQPADVYLDSKSLGVFCTAAPRCQRGILPDDYKLIVERPGHKKLSERVVVTLGQTLTLERTLVEEPSAVTVAVVGADTTPAATPAATIVLDGKELGPAPQAVTVEPGEHTLEVRAAGHATEQQPFAARRGEAVALTVTLRPLVPVAVTPADAEVVLGATPVARQDGALILPPGALSLTVRAKGFTTETIAVPAVRPAGFRLDVALQPAPAPVTITGAPRGAVVRVDGRVAGTVPLAAPLELTRGDHTIEVTAPQRAPYRTRVAVDSDTPLALEVTRMPSTRRTWTWIAAAGTGAAMISWGAFGALALQRDADFDDRAGEPGVTPMDPKLTSLADSGGTFATLSDISLGLTLVGAGTATWLFLREGKAASAGRITPLLAPGAVGVQGSF